MAEKSGKITTIDTRLNPNEPVGPATSLDMPMRPKTSTSNVRGQGGIHKQMNGVRKGFQ